MSSVNCPNCSHEFDTDDLYNANLFEEGDHDVSCPKCKHEFRVEAWTTFQYDVIEED